MEKVSAAFWRLTTNPLNHCAFDVSSILLRIWNFRFDFLADRKRTPNPVNKQCSPMRGTVPAQPVNAKPFSQFNLIRMWL
jgi:hypothetical protein